MAALQNQTLKDLHPPGTAAALQASSAGKQGRGGAVIVVTGAGTLS